MLLPFFLFSQSNIQQSLSVNSTAAAADASAQLDVSATDKGMLVPRMTSAQRTAIASPATGLLVFDTDTGGFWFFNGTAWVSLASPKTLADADGDTKIQVEESPDEDIIRFDLDGTEKMVLRKNSNGSPRLELIDGITNTFLGLNAGSANTTGFQNTANGGFSLVSNTEGFNNTAMGASSLLSNTTGSYNTANGFSALHSNTTGNYNTAIGADALKENSIGERNTATGVNALKSATGNRNTANGTNALAGNLSGAGNTALGDEALFSNTTGSANVAIGKDALYANTIRSNLVAVGDSALYNNGTGSALPGFSIDNTAVGSKALYSNTLGYSNTAIGFQALVANTTGICNTANGRLAMYSNTTGNYNTANGYYALVNNTTGHYNTANGMGALLDNITGHNNTANGFHALYFAKNSGNTASGASAGSDTDNSTDCTYIGYDADNDNYENTYCNSTALGNGSRMTASNQVRIGNSSVTSIGGFQGWTNVSDGRFKKDVQENVPGLAFIRKLRPVTYHLDANGLAEHVNEDVKDTRGDQTQNVASVAALQAREEKAAFLETGFIAQEVETAAKELGYEFSGLDAPKNATSLYGLRYAEFVVPLVKAIQEMDARDGVQENEIEQLKIENAALKSQIEKITAALAGAGIEVDK